MRLKTELEDLLAKQLGYEGQKGAAITDVREDTPAAQAGLQESDLIVEANHEKVTSAEDLERALNQAKDKDSVLLLLKRKDASLFVVSQIKHWFSISHAKRPDYECDTARRLSVFHCDASGKVANSRMAEMEARFAREV
jgi:S1-C subfamily serine protease